MRERNEIHQRSVKSCYMHFTFSCFHLEFIIGWFLSSSLSVSSDFFRYLRGHRRISLREDSRFQRAVWLRQVLRSFFSQPINSWLHPSVWFRHRFFTLHRYGTGATSFLFPLSRIPLRKCISGERAFSDVTHIQIRTHACTHHALARVHMHAQHARGSERPDCTVKGKSAGECAWGTSVSTSIKPRFRGLGPNLLSRPLPPSPPSSPPPSSIGAFSTISSHVLEYEMRAAIFLPVPRRSTRFYDFTRSSDDERYSIIWILRRPRRSLTAKIAAKKRP